jgi:hypothetical protein
MVATHNLSSEETMQCTKAAIRRMVTAIALAVPIVFVAGPEADATLQGRAILGAHSQSGGVACLAKPTLSERLEYWPYS